jgi:hypothetical protein
MPGIDLWKTGFTPPFVRTPIAEMRVSSLFRSFTMSTHRHVTGRHWADSLKWEYSEKETSLKIVSRAFDHGKFIPDKYTCNGENISPPLEWKDAPGAAKELVLVTDDPDAPGTGSIAFEKLDTQDLVYLRRTIVARKHSYLLLADPELVTFPRARRRAAAFFACLASAGFEATARDSRCNTSSRARERLAEGFVCLPLRPFSKSRSARFRVASEVVPFLGGGSGTPARRAFERPIAIACSGDRAPCLPCRISSISSRTNSPA